MDTETDYTTTPLDQLLGCDETMDDRDNFGSTVGGILYGMNMKSYIHIFQDANIGLDLFLRLSEDDLAVLGVDDEKDRKTLAKLIKNLRNKKNVGMTEGDNALWSPAAEPKLSMREVVLIHGHTARQLIRISQMLKSVEKGLKSGEFVNTSLDTEYCAARALMLICQEIEKQSGILHSELVNLNEVLSKISRSQERRSSRNGFLRNFLVKASALSSIVLALTVGGIYFWKRFKR